MELMDSMPSMGVPPSITALKELGLMICNPDGGPYSHSCSISPLLCVNGSCAKFCSVPFRSSDAWVEQERG